MTKTLTKFLAPLLALSLFWTDAALAFAQPAASSRLDVRITNARIKIFRIAKKNGVPNQQTLEIRRAIEKAESLSKEYQRRPSAALRVKITALVRWALGIAVGSAANPLATPSAPEVRPQIQASPTVASRQPESATSQGDGVIFQTSFENDSWYGLLYRGNVWSIGKKFTEYSPDSWRETRADNVKSWRSSLGWQNHAGRNTVWGYQFNSFKEDGPLYLRYRRKYEPAFEFRTEAKWPGLFAYANYQPTDAGTRPSGFDNFSCRVQLMPDGWYDNASRKNVSWGDTRKAEPTLYCYHLDQITGYGDKFRQNLGTKVFVEAGKWYEYQMMIKPNSPGKKDGEANLWINGSPAISVTGLEFRKTEALKLNIMEFSAWAGGWSPAPQDQQLFDDDFVLSKNPVPTTQWGDLSDIGRPYYFDKATGAQKGGNEGSDTSPGSPLPAPPPAPAPAPDPVPVPPTPLPPNSPSEWPAAPAPAPAPAPLPAPPPSAPRPTECAEPDIQIGSRFWKACNVGASRPFSWNGYSPAVATREEFDRRKDELGGLYVLNGSWEGVCPAGYRVPSRADWNEASNAVRNVSTQWWPESRDGRVAEILKLPIVPYESAGVTRFDKPGLYHSSEARDSWTRFVFEFSNEYWAGTGDMFSSYSQWFALPVRCVRN